MKILITNDDGWDAPGIKSLVSVAKRFGEVWVVAPDGPMSGISHQLTMTEAMTLDQKNERSYSLTGKPADCARVGLTHFGIQFDWILSGINYGANLGADIPVSGTVAAVREASFFGCPGIAISQYLNGMRSPFEWELSEKLVARLLPALFDSNIQSGQWFNVNLPDTQGQPVDDVEFVKTIADANPLPANYAKLGDGKIANDGKYQDRKTSPGSDVEVCFKGGVSITQH
jgi:5'-nucleotidase